eukprot:5594624-Alexandrium_andersonii.AAC.1
MLRRRTWQRAPAGPCASPFRCCGERCLLNARASLLSCFASVLLEAAWRLASLSGVVAGEAR